MNPEKLVVCLALLASIVLLSLTVAKLNRKSTPKSGRDFRIYTKDVRSAPPRAVGWNGPNCGAGDVASCIQLGMQTSDGSCPINDMGCRTCPDNIGAGNDGGCLPAGCNC